MPKHRFTYKTAKEAQRERKKKLARRKFRKEKELGFIFDTKLSSETTRSIVIVILFVLALLSFLSMIKLAGKLGEFLSKILLQFFGWGAYLFPFIILGVACALVVALKSEKFSIKSSNWVGLVLFSCSLSGLFHVFFKINQALEVIEQGKGGGYLGFSISFPLQQLMGFWATLILLLALFFISIILLFNVTFQDIIRLARKIKNFLASFFKKISERAFPKEEIQIRGIQNHESQLEDEEIVLEKGKKPNRKQKELFPFLTIKKPGKEKDKKKERISLDSHRSRWRPFSLDLLDGRSSTPTAGDIKANARIIKETLANFGIEVEMHEVNIGPTVTQYTLKPAEGVKLSQITTLQNDLALALAAHPLRIEAPIPRRSLVGIEVPNQAVALVRLREILESSDFSQRKSNLTLALGRNVAGTPVLADLDKMPHLLIAGATGSGKTVALNAIILTLIYQNSPEVLKLILVDPKKVEMYHYNDTPYLLTPTVVEIDKTINALRWTVAEMDRRFKILAQTKKRDIASYNSDSIIKEKMPYIVLIIDELADLMSVAANEVEACVVRLAQMARATGIHLILATQRPSVNVITGLIKANITARIAFTVASQIDSRTIIDMAGAEKLLGNGDMLFSTPDLGKPLRIQGAYISEGEIKRVCRALKEKGEPSYNEEILAPQGVMSDRMSFREDITDELYEQAKKLVIASGKASASFLQRRLRIGYARAARLLDMLEEEGIVGPADGARPRKILVEGFEEAGREDESF